MLDIKWIRENPRLLDESLISRNAEAFSDRILDLDKSNRAVLSQIQSIQSRRNEIASQIGIAKKK